jgi:hypothetical protein
MFPTDGIRSQLEWSSTLTTEVASVATEVNRHHRKVWLIIPFFFVPRLMRTDIYNSYYWYAYISSDNAKKKSYQF